MKLYTKGFGIGPYKELLTLYLDPPLAPCFVQPEYRNARYHAGRSLYFRDCFLHNTHVDPCDIYIIDYKVTLTDGHHRLAGALLANKEFIDCAIVKRISTH